MLSALALAATAPMAAFYIGTYTTPTGSKGIYHAVLNEQTGSLSAPALSAEIENPSYIALNELRLYAVQEFSGGKVSAFKRGASSVLEPINTKQFDGGGPCHLSLGGDAESLYSAAYGGGSVGKFGINGEGGLTEPVGLFKNTGSGANPNRQQAPHLHFVQQVPRSQWVLACDLGTDSVLVFDGSLALKHTFKAAPGAGPRHLAIHPKLDRVYVTHELNSTVQTLKLDRETGALESLAAASTLPEIFVGSNSTAAIKVHRRGKWLAVSNRGHNSLAVFPVAEDGTLGSGVQYELGLAAPRDFSFSPSGKWIVAGGQDSDNLKSFSFDPATGKVGPAAHEITVSRPVCVVFAP